VSGPEVVLAAPAIDIVSTDRVGDGRSGYATGVGTSASTAIVAGAVALVRSKYPDLPATEVIHRLTATADDRGPPGRDNDYGYGIVNLVKALTADVPPIGATTGPTQTPEKPQERTSTGRSVLYGATLLFALAAVGFVVWRFRR
jgi:subtilisin family serine protease